MLYKSLQLKKVINISLFFYSNYSKTYKIFIEIQGNSHLDKKHLDLDKTRARRNIDEGDILIIQYYTLIKAQTCLSMLPDKCET